MSQTNVPAPRGNLQRDVQARPRLATLTCPNCLGTLQIQADKSAEAPCPICRHPLKYVAPPPAETKRFVARQRIPASAPEATPQAPPRQVTPPPAQPQPHIPQPRTQIPQPRPQARRQEQPPKPAAPAPTAPPRPQTTPAAPAPDQSLRARLKRMDEFLNTPAGTSLAWVLLAVLLTACVILFFHWDHDRRERTLRMEAIESTRPAASHRPSTSSVPLLPGEPAPVNTFRVEE